MTIYPKYLEVENIRQNVIFKVLKEAVTKSGNKPANDVYFGLYNAQASMLPLMRRGSCMHADCP